MSQRPTLDRKPSHRNRKNFVVWCMTAAESNEPCWRRVFEPLGFLPPRSAHGYLPVRIPGEIHLFCAFKSHSIPAVQRVHSHFLISRSISLGSVGGIQGLVNGWGEYLS